MGIDYGSRKTGVALSDEKGEFAFPYEVLPTNARLAEALAAIAGREEVGVIIVGESLDYGGRENPLMADIRAFTKTLEGKTRLPVRFESEMFTTQEARRIQGEHERIDASAAALILQTYLDKHKISGTP